LAGAAKEVVLACGAIERPLVFPDNDRPGVMLADAARTFLSRYGSKVGARIVVASAHDSAYGAALDLADAGAEIALIADLRAKAEGALPQAARAAGLKVMTGASIAGVRGKLRVQSVGAASGSSIDWIDCDALLMSGGWTPSVHLLRPASRLKAPLTRTAGFTGIQPIPAVAIGNPSSIFRTTSAPRTSSSPSAKGCVRSSTSSATRQPAWRRTRA
jgi:sarcosine oxidase subunit alpha